MSYFRTIACSFQKSAPRKVFGDETAHTVGRRKSPTPVILRIDAAAAARAGVAFYAGNDKVWLADRIAPEFMTGETG